MSDKPVPPLPRKTVRAGDSFRIEVPDGGELPARTVERLVAFRALEVYMAAPGMSVEYVWEKYRLHPTDQTSALIKDSISLNKLKYIAKVDGWEERRKKLHQDMEAELLRRMQSSIMEQRMRELNLLRTVQEVAMNNIFGIPDPTTPGAFLLRPVRPRSLEGLTTAVVRLDKHIEEKRALVAGEIPEATRDVIDNAVAGDGLVVFDDAFTDEEVERMANVAAEGRALRSKTVLLKGGEE